MTEVEPELELARDTLFQKRIGHPVRDEESLRAGSPLFHAERIRAPVLIVDGANDKRTSSRQSQAMVDAMRARDADVEFLLVDDEGHGFRNASNRLKFYRLMEEFLAKHIGGRTSLPGNRKE